MNRKIKLLDGATATEYINKYNIKKDYYCSLNSKNKDIVNSIHNNYLNNNSDFILTNTFSFLDYFLNNDDDKYLVDGIDNAFFCINKFENKNVILDIGPPFKKNINQEKIYEKTEKIVKIAKNKNIKYCIIETCMDIKTTKTIYDAVKKNSQLNIIISFYFNNELKSLDNHSIKETVKYFNDFELMAFGANCINVFNENIIEELVKYCDHKILIKPNKKDEIDSKFASQILKYVKNYEDIHFVGGCCGTDSNTIKEIYLQLKENGYK